MRDGILRYWLKCFACRTFHPSALIPLYYAFWKSSRAVQSCFSGALFWRGVGRDGRLCGGGRLCARLLNRHRHDAGLRSRNAVKQRTRFYQIHARPRLFVDYGLVSLRAPPKTSLAIFALSDFRNSRTFVVFIFAATDSVLLGLAFN